MNSEISEILQSVGRKWTLEIMEETNRHGPLGFNHYMKHVRGITPKTLNESLQALIDIGLIRKSDGEHPEYMLTKKGKEFHDKIIVVMRRMFTRVP